MNLYMAWIFLKMDLREGIAKKIVIYGGGTYYTQNVEYEWVQFHCLMFRSIWPIENKLILPFVT